MASKVIKIKIGTDVHQMVDNKGEKIGCYECSLFNMCSNWVTARHLSVIL